ncbi:MAG: DNA polymerase I [Clostridia bacterium]|nr:DNA polymerase I [Clostridia bacterium]
MKLLCIDGNSIINRAFYGIKLLTTKDGLYTNALYGFINILNRLLESEKPDGVAVAFDLKAPTFRHLKYSEYKAGRKGMPEELHAQMPILKEWLRLAGYTCIECEGYEADDILGTLAKICEETGNECVISTGDRDSLQLISDKTRVVLVGNRENINYTKEALFEKYGLTPEEMIEFKALMGDSSDNIPGVAGVGEKTATDLITKYHNIDYIYENLDSLDIKDTIRLKLANGRESAYLSRDLGTICKTAPINGNIADYKTRPRNDGELARLMTKLEFFKLMEKMGLTPDNRQSNATESKTVKTYKQEKPTVFDSITLYSDENGFAGVVGNNVFPLSKVEFEIILLNKEISKTVHNAKAVWKEYPKAENIIFDPMLGAYLCNPSASSYAVDRLIAEYCTETIEVSDETLKNACLLNEACITLFEELKKTEQLKLLKEIEIPLSRVLSDMENVGFKVDKKALQNMSAELGERISLIEKEVFDLVGYEFNLNSPKQLGIALFEKLGLPAKKKTKSGYSTGAEVLEELKNIHPAVALILEYRQLAKLKSTYTDGLQDCIEADGRIHTTFNQVETRTGRISSLEPNLQNIPVRTEMGRRLREFFVAEEGNLLVDADYSQIELRVLAHISGDKAMQNAFKSETDIHTVTASQVFGVPLDFVTPVMRSRAKAVNFGIVYGIGAFSLSKDIGVTRKEADTYIKNYLSTYKGVARYMENAINDAKLNGFVTTIFSRRRYLPELHNSNKMLVAFGERVARNAPIQGSAADIIKLAMIRVWEKLKTDYPTAKLILQVHDELIVECSEKDAEGVRRLLSSEMENAVNLSVKLTADAAFGKNWLEAKG